MGTLLQELCIASNAVMLMPRGQNFGLSLGVKHLALAWPC